MENILLPGCAAIFSALLLIIYLVKPKIEIKENKLYLIILIAILCDSILACLLQIICINGVSSTEMYLIDLFNRLDFLSLITYSSCVFLYTFLITVKNGRNLLDKVGKIVLFVDLALVILMAFLKINLISSGERFSIDGSAATLTFMVSGFYLLSSVIIGLFHYKQVDRRHIPLAVVIALATMDLILFTVNPYLIIISITLTFVNYVMFFTIENPDARLINRIETAKEEAERANKAKTDFLSSMSHEIRTPLNAIVGFSECIKKEETLEKAKEDANDIITASNNLLEIVNGILDISKIEAGKMELVEAEYDLAEVATNLVKLVSTRIGEKPITMNTYFAPDIPGVLYGDGGKIRQIMSNILINAIKYTEKGYIDFSITCINQGNQSKLVISIEDTGRGIKPEKMDALFNKFERLEEDRNTTLEGTGLGLAITKRLVEMMNGKIVVQSKYGEGSKFTIYLAQTIKSMEKKKKDENVSNVNEYPNHKVLVVDDNKLNIKIESRMLTDMKIDVDSALSGDECITKIQNGKYDLILMDDMMPVMSGTDTMKKLRQMSEFETPVVVLTANAIDGMKEKYIEDGFDDYLAKPMDKNELKRVLNKYLNPNSNLSNTGIFDPLPSSLYTITDKDLEKIEDSMQIEPSNKEEIVNKEEPKTTEVEQTVSIEREEPVKKEESAPIEIEKQEESSSNKGSREFLESNGVDVNASLELLGSMEMFDETITSFISEIDERVPKMKEYKEANNMKDYAILAHAIKSDSKYLGFKKLAELAYDHEMKGKEDNSTYINEHYDELMNEIDNIMAIIKEYKGEE